jgi:hypothetical protein
MIGGRAKLDATKKMEQRGYLRWVFMGDGNSVKSRSSGRWSKAQSPVVYGQYSYRASGSKP